MSKMIVRRTTMAAMKLFIIGLFLSSMLNEYANGLADNGQKDEFDFLTKYHEGKPMAKVDKKSLKIRSKDQLKLNFFVDDEALIPVEEPNLETFKVSLSRASNDPILVFHFRPDQSVEKNLFVVKGEIVQVSLRVDTCDLGNFEESLAFSIIKFLDRRLGKRVCDPKREIETFEGKPDLEEKDEREVINQNGKRMECFPSSKHELMFIANLRDKIMKMERELRTELEGVNITRRFRTDCGDIFCPYRKTSGWAISCKYSVTLDTRRGIRENEEESQFKGNLFFVDIDEEIREHGKTVDEKLVDIINSEKVSQRFRQKRDLSRQMSKGKTLISGFRVAHILNHTISMKEATTENLLRTCNSVLSKSCIRFMCSKKFPINEGDDHEGCAKWNECPFGEKVVECSEGGLVRCGPGSCETGNWQDEGPGKLISKSCSDKRLHKGTTAVGFSSYSEKRRVKNLCSDNMFTGYLDPMSTISCIGEETVESLDIMIFLKDRTTNFIPFVNMEIKRLQNPKSIHSYSCNPSCLDGTCNGDDLYKENFGKGPKPDFCAFKHEEFYLAIMNEGEEVYIDCMEIREVFVKRLKKTLNLSSEVLTENLHIECGNHFLSIRSEFTMRFLKLCDEMSCVMMELNETSKMVELPASFSMTTKSLKLNLQFEDFNEMLNKEVKCEYADPCESLECEFCYSKFQNVNCMQTHHWLIILLLVAIMTSLFLLIFLVCATMSKKFLRMTSWVLKCIYCLCWKLQKTTTGHCKNLQERVSDVERGIVMEMQLSKETKESEPERILKEIKIGASRSSGNGLTWFNSRTGRIELLNLLAIVLVLLVSGINANSCQDGIKLIAKGDSLESVDAETYLFSTSTIFNFPAVGGSTCWQILDITEKPLGLITLTVNNVRDYCEKDSLYFVPEYNLLCNSFHQCRSAGNCSDDYCEKTNVDNREMKILPRISTYQRNFCKRVCGCAGCGCGLCAQSCMFYSTFVENKASDFYELFTCTDWKLKAEVTIKLTKNSVNGKMEVKEQKIVLSPGVEKPFDQISVSITGSSSIPAALKDKCFSCKDSLCSILECNRGTENVMGKMGEFRCPSIKAAMTVDATCTHNKNLFKVEVSSDGVVCFDESINRKAAFSQGRLPRLISEGELTSDKGDIYFRTVGFQNMIGMMSVRGLLLRGVNDRPQCHVEFVSLNGCFDCMEGSTLVLKGKCKGKDSIGYVECPGTKTVMSIHVGAQEEVISLKPRFDRKEIKEFCNFSIGASKGSFPITGSLLYIPHSSVANEKVQVFQEVSSSTFDFPNLIWGSWYSKLITIVIISAAAFLIFKFIKNRVLGRRRNQKRSD